MANPLRFLRRRRNQPKGRATPQSAFFSPVGGQIAGAGEPFFAPEMAFVQPKLTVNKPGDAHEQEADNMANHVVQRATMKPDEEKVQRRGKPDEDDHIQKKDAKEEEKPIQKKAGPGTSAAPVSAAQLHSTKGQGSPLPAPVQREMGQAFGHDFGPVRIHTGSRAEQLSQDMQALAFTHGKDVYFNAGQYNPETTEGRRLLAHELTHVVQQNGTELTEVQRYTVPGRLPCNEVVGWLDTRSPHAPAWAETKCNFVKHGRLTVSPATRLPDGTVKVTVKGSPGLSVSNSCTISSPNWSPTTRPNRASEVDAWNSMKAQLMAHEQIHVEIGEEQRQAAEASYQAIDFEVIGTNRADAMSQVRERVRDEQDHELDAAPRTQASIDPFTGATLTCPPQP